MTTAVMEQDGAVLSLNAMDRCDRCGAQARHVARKEGLADLLFCNHHEGKHSEALLDNGWVVITDQSNQL